VSGPMTSRQSRPQFARKIGSSGAWAPSVDDAAGPGAPCRGPREGYRAPMTLRIAIIGSGFSGLCLGIQLRKAGIESFTIYEKAEHLGGTWRDNTYPGAACDSPAFAYCFSFEQKTDWTRKWVPHDEILGYMEHCAEKYGLLPKIRFGVEIAEARFDEDVGVWNLRSAAGEEIQAEVLVSGTGQLNRPHVPDIPGLDDFRGPHFHSARWDHGCDLSGRRVAVIGNAASAIQFVPEIAPRVERLTIFQRSANWMLPRFDRAYSEAEKRRFTRHPWLAKLYRWWIWASFEMRWPAFRRNRWLSERIARVAERHMREVVRDPKLQDALVPDYPVGGKRILISDDYYPTLNRENVEVVTAGIDHVEADAVVTRDGRRVEADVLIVATGFESTSFLAPIEIYGRGGRSLQKEWADGARAYLGITVSGYPNFFMMYGPNTNLGHNSIIFMIECQTRYIMDCIRRLRRSDVAWIDLRPEVMEAFNRKLERELRDTVWADTGKSWYKTADGRITNNWSGSTIRYWWNTRRAEPLVYSERVREAGAASA
jgi:cation diffusion facilitator CzcD-associated flavoprotein CzcO